MPKVVSVFLFKFYPFVGVLVIFVPIWIRSTSIVLYKLSRVNG